MGSEDRVGLGLRLTLNHDNLPQVTTLQKRGSAWASGMVKEGDFLLAVRDEDAWIQFKGLPVEEIEKHLSGPAGSYLRIRVKRREITYDCVLERLKPATPGPSTPISDQQGTMRRRTTKKTESLAEAEQRIHDGMARVNRARVQQLKEDGLFPDSAGRRPADSTIDKEVPAQTPVLDFPPDSAPGALQSNYRGKLVVVDSERQGRVRPFILIWLWHKLCLLIFGSLVSLQFWSSKHNVDDVERGGHGVGRLGVAEGDSESDSESD
mmetsp:Transcript_36681/g.57297  ORF Transcript_36681/g.57297 Transcript_36681/m.57297 type:complete len:265 (-) Transcript_36681:1527-2321(-)